MLKLLEMIPTFTPAPVIAIAVPGTIMPWTTSACSCANTIFGNGITFKCVERGAHLPTSRQQALGSRSD